jgi:mono/diheme cytochrome c family protein
MAVKVAATQAIAGIIALGVIGVGGAYSATALFGAIGGDVRAGLTTRVGPQLVQRGQYIAEAGDCAACHTAPGGKPFAGGLPIGTPIGTVYTTNITPDPNSGIGLYSYGDFERAVRRGIRPDGSSLYPAMPFPSYARVSDTDMQALYAYFSHDVQPVEQKNKAEDIPWPLSMRWPLTYWRWLFAPGVQATQVTASDDPALGRGAYLVEGLGHCGTCHTPRGLALQEKALTGKGGANYLSGGLVNDYVANNLRSDVMTGLGAWSEDDIVQFLKTGRNTKTAAFGGMTEVVEHSMQYMTDADLHAIAHYLKSLPALGRDQFVYAPATGTALTAGDISARGSLDYLNNCAACHLSSGKGYRSTFPALAGNPVVDAADPSSLINIVLNGSTELATEVAPTQFTMPPFSTRLTDQEIADVLTFVRSSWGNKAPPVTPEQVVKIRVAPRMPVSPYLEGDPRAAREEVAADSP